MRTLTSLATLAIAVTTSATFIRPADACGSYMMEPKVLRLSSHHADRGVRTFALLAQEQAAKGARFVPLAPDSYDSTKVSDVADLANPVAMTLVGRAGTRKVESAKHVFLAQSYFVAHGKPMSALEMPAVDDGEFSIAVVGGRFRTLAWSELTASEPTTSDDVAWLKTRGMDVAASTVYRQPLAKGVVAFSSYDVATAGFTTTVRHDDYSLGTMPGMPLGILIANGQSYVVIDHDGITRTVAIW